jgi:hypothetical protein
MSHFIREPELLVVGAIVLASVTLPQVALVKAIVLVMIKLFG